ncbi:DUF2017 domain-containing protein [Kocuria sp.]|uniref:DUF2017 domain-containing protein n=1 Tax=Kocuria sp. TaxID=1871328 RepID=UPI0026DEF608|nr:DUF2017 domain-containing protein [Kocuria sp.]MDO5618361.1 DUF2017 domain-containing protein [Kocuria sp.]
MAQAFRSTPHGMIARLDPQERGLLRRLFEDVVTMLEPEDAGQTGDDGAVDPLEQMLGFTEDVEAPRDPALHRLLPDASSNAERSQEFRRYTERSLREEKVGALRRAAMAVEHDPVQLEGTAVQDFSRALNDVRLVLATRLEIESEEDARRVEAAASQTAVGKIEDAQTYMAVVYGFVSWLQNSLVEAMLLDLPGDHLRP